jgi:hypothetical protein
MSRESRNATDRAKRIGAKMGSAHSLDHLVRRFYGPQVKLVKVKDLKRGMEMVRSRIGGVAGNPGFMTVEVLGCYPVADGNYFVQCGDGMGENVHGEKQAIIVPPNEELSDSRRRGCPPMRPSCLLAARVRNGKGRRLFAQVSWLDARRSDAGNAEANYAGCEDRG